MISRLLRPSLQVAVVAAALASWTPARARPGTCKGKLSGAVTAKFDCSAVVGTTAEGTIAFAVNTPGPVEGLPAVVPGTFLLPEPPRKRSYTLDELGLGRASVAAQGGVLYVASKTAGQRGEVMLTLRSVRKHATVPGGYEVHGRYRARLPAMGANHTGEVVVEVEF